MNRSELHRKIHTYVLLALFFTLPFSLLLNALCIGILALNWILEGNFRSKIGLLGDKTFYWLCSAYFLVLALRCLFSHDPVAAFHITERKATFLLLPWVFMSVITTMDFLEKLGKSFTLAMLLATACCFAAAGYRYFISGDTGVFFYHELGKPLNLHAVYFSVLLLLNLFLLNHALPAFKGKNMLRGWMLVFICLLSSKLLIVLSLLYSGWYMFAQSLKGMRVLKISLVAGFLLLSGGLFLLPNPVSERFRDISFHRLELLKQDQIGKDVYLDGLSLRLLQSRFAAEILSENKTWLTGTGPDLSQARLDEKYRAVDLYTSEKDKGYIGYNFHNQFIETTVQGGIIPALVLIALFVFLIVKALRTGNTGLLLSCSLFVLFCLTESVFERQLGVVAFLCFICYWILYNKTLKTNPKRIE